MSITEPSKHTRVSSKSYFHSSFRNILVQDFNLLIQSETDPHSQFTKSTAVQQSPLGWYSTDKKGD